ncbi:TPA: hypothetical protein ACGO2G_000279 [Streptococcus suis]
MSLNNISKKQLEDVKININNYLDTLDGINEIRGDIVYLLKQIIFFKMLSLASQDDITKGFYLKIVSDLYYIIDCLQKKQVRYFYFNVRSLLENYLRLLMKTTTENNHITNEVFRKFKEKFSTITNQQFILHEEEFSLIKSEYSTACEFVHGGEVIKDSLVFVSDDFIIPDDFSRKNKCEKIRTILKIFNRLLLHEAYEDIDSTFHRKKTILEYLNRKSFRDALELLKSN